MIPAILLRVHARLGLCGRSCRAGTTASGHAVSMIVQIVKGLFDEAMLEEEARRIAIGATVIGIPRLVQRIAKHLTTLGNPTANENARQLAELDIGEAILAELEAAPISDGDAARRTGIPVPLYAVEHRRQLEVLRLPLQSLPLAEALGQLQGLVPQKVQYVAEEDTVTVQKIAAFAVLGECITTLGTSEQLMQQRRLVLQQSIQRRRIVDTAHVELHNFRHLNEYIILWLLFVFCMSLATCSLITAITDVAHMEDALSALLLASHLAYLTRLA